MAYQLKASTSPGLSTSTRRKSVIVLVLILTLLLLGFYHQSLLVPSRGGELEPGLGVHREPAETTAASSDTAHFHSAPGAVSSGGDGQKHETLILYVYADSKFDIARKNLEFFVEKGLHGAADFIFIFNGETDAVDLIPKNLANVRVVKRDNTCFDIGAVGEVLRENELWRRYKRFITMNASVRGPFLPVWSSQCWTDAFLDKITDETKLIGLTYSCFRSPHVQSMLLATDSVGMSILIDPDLAYSVPEDNIEFGNEKDPVGFTPCFPDYYKAVHAEIGMARLIRSQGFRVDVMLTSTHKLGVEEYCEKTGFPPGHLENGGYFGANVHPYETLFAKANRGIEPGLLDHLTEWHLSSNESSWDTCGR